MGLNFIGIENNAGYIAAARARLEKVQGPSETALVETPNKKSEPRVPFGWLVERGLLEPGTVLFDHRRRHSARVHADGSIKSSDHRGSINKVGAAVQGAPACNGWQFWHFEAEGDLLSIDILRQKVRAELH